MRIIENPRLDTSCNTPSISPLIRSVKRKFEVSNCSQMGQICQAHMFPSPSLPCVVTLAKLATAPLAHARDARPRPCRPCLARRPARSSPEASSWCLSRPRLSLALTRERRAMAAARTLPARVTRVPRYHAPSACSHRRVAARHASVRMPAQPRRAPEYNP
jgi:hypothetical protein